MQRMYMFLIMLVMVFIPNIRAEAKTSSPFLETEYFDGSIGDVTRSFSIPDYMFMEDIMSSEATQDNVGRYQSGYFFYCPKYGDLVQFQNKILTCDGGYLYITRQEIVNDTLPEGLKQIQFKVFCTKSVKVLTVYGNYAVEDGSGNANVSSGETTIDPRENGTQIAGFNICYDSENLSFDDKVNVGFFCTNLPVFDADDSEAIKAYVESGDYSGAENSNTIDYDSIEFDESVEMPQGLKLTGGFEDGYTKQTPYGIEEDIILTWSQNVDTSGYIYTVDVKMSIEMLNQNIKDGKPTGEIYTTEWLPMRDTQYKGSTSITCKLRASEVENILIPAIGRVYKDSTGKSGLPYKGYYINSIVVRVRNVSKSKCSNYVVVKIDRDGSTVTATVENQEEETVPDDQYDGGSVLDKPEVNGDLSSFSDILVFIKNGFGLFGSNGLIAMFRSFFSFLPEMWWNLILLGLGLIIFIGIVNFLLKR